MSSKSGFTLIEMIVAMAAASIVALSAYTFMAQSSLDFNRVVASYLAESSRLMGLVQQSQKGLCLEKTGKNKRASRMTRPN